jgi:seryl-tRNA synthetase
MTRKRIRKERGFIQLPVLGWAAVGGFLLILGLSVALKVQSARLEAVQAEYGAFKTEVKRLGEEQEKKTKETIKAQEKKSHDRIKSLEDRLSRTRADFDRLRNSASKSELPAVPDTARAANDEARDKQLLSVLQHAQEQTDRLIELQEWVRQQYGP